MAESQNTTAFREFSREESVLLELFLDEALEELERVPSAQAIHRVLEKLTSDVSNHFRLVLGHRAGITTITNDDGAREIVLPAEPLKKDYFMISMGLDMYGGNGEDHEY